MKSAKYWSLSKWKKVQNDERSTSNCFVWFKQA